MDLSSDATPFERGNAAHGNRQPVVRVDQCEIQRTRPAASQIVQRGEDGLGLCGRDRPEYQVLQLGLARRDQMMGRHAVLPELPGGEVQLAVHLVPGDIAAARRDSRQVQEGADAERPVVNALPLSGCCDEPGKGRTRHAAFGKQRPVPLGVLGVPGGPGGADGRFGLHCRFRRGSQRVGWRRARIDNAHVTSRF